jgi:alkylresorcinol/alkylpyrone synthase
LAVEPRIFSTSVSQPPCELSQDEVRDHACQLLFGEGWATRSEVADSVHQLARLFKASGVHRRSFAIDPRTYYDEPRGTGQRMRDYEDLAYPLARAALEPCLTLPGGIAGDEITDFLVVSCTGYATPGLDAYLARDLGMRPDVRRVMIGHMGCFGAIVGLRQALAAVRAQPDARVALLTVELCSLHYMNSDDHGVQTGYALFGDAAAAAVLGGCGGEGPQVVDSYCSADFASIKQMSWNITDEGFVMGLSRRIPVSLGRALGPVIDRLLAPHGLTPRDVRHWLIHPGGPDILRVVQSGMKLSEEQVQPSYEVLAEYGNCSSSTVLIILDRMLASGRCARGEWGIMMAFGPGLSIETCLIRF